MADYVSSNTDRYRLLQTGPRGSHFMQFRVVPGTTEIGAITAITPIIEAMIPFMLDGSSWASCEKALEGSDVFLPVPWTPINATAGPNPLSNLQIYGAYINFVGRSTGGSRVAFYLFNVHMAYMTANNRLTGAENANVTAVLDAFAANSGDLAAIDQNTYVMKAYANTGINDKVAKKSRSIV
jgi:hypothetical protein